MDEPTPDVRFITDQDQIAAYLKQIAAQNITVVVRGPESSDEARRRVQTLAAQAVGEWYSETGNQDAAQTTRLIDHGSSDHKLNVRVQGLALTKEQIESLDNRIRLEIADLPPERTFEGEESGSAFDVCVVAREVGERITFPVDMVDLIASGVAAGRRVRILYSFTDRDRNIIDLVVIEVENIPSAPVAPSQTRVFLRNEIVYFTAPATRIFGWHICGDKEVQDVVAVSGATAGGMLLDRSTTDTIVFQKHFYLWWGARAHHNPDQFWQVHGGRTVTYAWLETR